MPFPEKAIIVAAGLYILSLVVRLVYFRTRTSIMHCIAIAGTLRIYADCVKEVRDRR